MVRPPVAAIVGPTAAGKTAAALALAERHPIEVLSLDSMQIYRYLDIGTGKPTASERARVPHHIVDVVDPDEHFDAARWVELAEAALADIRRRGRVPVIVGGTGLYLRAFTYGLAEIPPIPAEVRERLAEELAARGPEALHARLERVDPTLAARLPPTDRQRILRALEVYEATGTPLSAWQARHGFADVRRPVRVVALAMERDRLYARIDARARAMVEGGLVDEVRAVLARGFDPARCRALRVPGYREAVAVLAGEMTTDEMLDSMARGHRRYARRQLTWFRGHPGVTWVEAGDLAAIERALGDSLEAAP